MQMATVTRQRRRHAAVARGTNGSNPCDAVKFAAGSLESELAAIGKAVPAAEWAKTPSTTSPTSTTTSTARRKRNEAGLRGYALLGRDPASAGPVPCAGDRRAEDARGNPTGHK